jgi:CrcB protein
VVFTPEVRVFIFIGILGGFTTFSTFGYETFSMMRDGQFILAATNVGLQVILGLAGVWLGYSFSRAL